MNDFDILRNLLKSDRSVRRYDESRRISRDHLIELLDLTRFCASGRNLQPLKYRIVNDPDECDRVFPLLAWAGYLQDWDGPSEGERPTAYLVQCLDTRLTKNCLCDDGLQLQAITLGTTAMGMGGCIVKSFNMALIRKELSLPEWAHPMYVLALGYPKEEVRIEEADNGIDADIKYFRTADGVHHVPKRPLADLLI